MEKLREDLRELTDAASVLLDDRLYTFESYRSLVQAVAYAKVALAKEDAEEETLQGAYTGLCEAVDAMEVREDSPEEKQENRSGSNNGQDTLRKALPFLLGGAVIGGLWLGKKLFGRKKSGRSEGKQEG